MKTKTKILAGPSREITKSRAIVKSTRSRAIPRKAGLGKARIESILVPIDFSVPSQKALAYAVPFAEQFGARLILLHVVEPVPMPDFANSMPLVMENEKIMAGCKKRLDGIAKEQAISPGLIDRTLVRQGRSFHEIASAARSLKVNLIIIATNGYTGLKHALLGSTAERVVRYAPCPVLVVREFERDFIVS